jgi:hypothetical protein
VYETASLTQAREIGLAIGVAYSSRVTTPYTGLCPSAHACISFMIDYVQEQGYGSAEIRALLDRIREPPARTPEIASPMTEGES